MARDARSIPRTSLILAALVALLLPGANGDIYLEATFDDKPLDERIGTGGAALGEPDWIHDELSAVVRSDPFGTPCLELHNTDPTQHRWIGFELPYGVTTGHVVAILDVWFYRIGSGDQFWLRFYSGDWSHSFLSLVFNEAGRVECSNESGMFAVLGPVVVGRSYPIMVSFDMDAGTFSLWLDGSPAITDQAHMVPAGTALQFVQWAARSNAAPDSRISIDQIRVLSTPVSAPAEETTWGRIRALYRG